MRARSSRSARRARSSPTPPSLHAGADRIAAAPGRSHAAARDRRSSAGSRAPAIGLPVCRALSQGFRPLRACFAGTRREDARPRHRCHLP
jgi:hypothetical protein